MGACPYVRKRVLNRVSDLPGRGDVVTYGDWSGRRVLAIESPTERVVGDVLPDAKEGIVIPNDVFIVVALPQVAVVWLETAALLQFGEATSCEGLESMHNISQRHRRGNPPWLP